MSDNSLIVVEVHLSFGGGLKTIHRLDMGDLASERGDWSLRKWLRFFETELPPCFTEDNEERP